MLVTRGDEFLQAVRQALAALRRLSHGPYARHDIAGILDSLGSRLETFLRGTALPTCSRRDSLKDLINALAPAGLPQPQVDALNYLRSLYNRSKHRPSEALPLGEVIDVVSRATGAISDLITLGLGTVQVPYEREINYHLYVIFYDHYSACETEVAVCLPKDHWLHVALVDTFSTHFKDSQRLEGLLTSHPRFQLGKEYFAPEVWKSFESEGEFATAGVWDGDYGELIRLLAPFDDRTIGAGLIPGLGRYHNFTSVAMALVIAAIDVVRAAKAPLTWDELAEAMKARADKEYAMPRSSRGIEATAAQVATLIHTIPFARWRHIVGPVLAQAKEDPSSSTPPGPLDIQMDGNAIVLAFW